MLKTIAAIPIAAAVLLSSTAIAARQDQYPETLSLRGEVLIEGGGPLAGARIRTDALRGPNGTQIVAQKVFTARTGKKGDWSLLGVSRGLWIFEVAAPEHLPHVVVVPISFMNPPDPRPWETSLSLLPVSAMGPLEGSALNSPQRLVLDAATRVQAGDRVSPGQVLALMGSTGCSTGPHLHFQVQRPGQGFVDPFNLLGLNGGSNGSDSNGP